MSGDQVVPGPGDPDAAGTVEVDLSIDPDVPAGGAVCTFWNILDVDPATSAEIRAGAPGSAGEPYLTVTPPDEEGFGGDCVRDLEPSIVQAIVDDPSGFFVQVANDAFPDGAIRGRIQIVEIVQVSVSEFVCPGSIRTAADVLAAPQGTCTIAVRSGDIGDPPKGFTWSPKPTAFDMRVNLTTADGILTLDDSEPEGGGTCGGRTCSIGISYVWRDLTPGPMTVMALTSPKGYTFGWATIQSQVEGGTAPTATVDVAHRSISFDMTDFGASDGISISIYDFRGR
ncbi:MAG TPA: CHRD domain-containing protein [Candidatus Limnocylindrales bacterium]|nr:CHRD domain-containing protein [Candidatus Limnocylindrales bacterium]